MRLIQIFIFCIYNYYITSGGEFYLQATGLYFSRFNFTGDPLDVAVRRLLMEIGLPRETQQIDRVMEAFAARYLRCNPELFVDKGKYTRYLTAIELSIV